MKVLVVDDDSEVRSVLKLSLEHYGCEVSVAENGEEGLQMAETFRPDVIVSDALMPKMDGFQFLRAVKKDERLKSIPFIFYSAVYTGYKEAELAISLGADEFIIKPKDPEEFWNELNSVLEELKLKKEKPLTVDVIKDDEFYRKYMDVVVTKLEEKVKELKEVNEKLEKSEKRYRNLFNSMRDVIIVADANRNILDANQPALRDTLGYELDEIAGKSTRIYYAGQDGYELAGKEIFDSKEFIQGKILELDFRRKNGEVFAGEMYALKLVEDDSQVVGNIAVIRDITKRKKMEDEIKQRVNELESFYQMAVTRELKMKSLKEEIARLKSELSKYQK